MGKRVAGRCRRCGCTNSNCQDCVERTGRPCTWVEPDLCSACTPRFEVLGLVVAALPGLHPGSIKLWWQGELVETRFDYIRTWPPDVRELHLPPDLWAIARRLLPRLAKKGALRL